MHIDSNSCHKFFIKDFFSKLEQICRFLWICSKLLKYSFTKKSSFSAFYILIFFLYIDILILWVSFYFNVPVELYAKFYPIVFDCSVYSLLRFPQWICFCVCFRFRLPCYWVVSLDVFRGLTFLSFGIGTNVWFKDCYDDTP